MVDYNQDTTVTGYRRLEDGEIKALHDMLIDDLKPKDDDGLGECEDDSELDFKLDKLEGSSKHRLGSSVRFATLLLKCFGLY
jgi:hypothetical protein